MSEEIPVECLNQFQFVNLDKIKDSLQCQICYLPYNKPIIHSCGNSYCEPCLRQTSEKKCPSCRVAFCNLDTHFIRNRALAESIDELPVKCIRPGCSFQCSRQQIVQHLKQKCTVRCSHKRCTVQFPSHSRNALTEHELNCPEKIVRCANSIKLFGADNAAGSCGFIKSLREHRESKHDETCPLKPLLDLQDQVAQFGQHAIYEQHIANQMKSLTKQFLMTQSMKNNHILQLYNKLDQLDTIQNDQKINTAVHRMQNDTNNTIDNKNKDSHSPSILLFPPVVLHATRASPEEFQKLFEQSTDEPKQNLLQQPVQLPQDHPSHRIAVKEAIKNHKKRKLNTILMPKDLVKEQIVDIDGYCDDPQQEQHEIDLPPLEFMTYPSWKTTVDDSDIICID